MTQGKGCTAQGIDHAEKAEQIMSIAFSLRTACVQSL
jgi:hypothetical protein